MDQLLLILWELFYQFSHSLVRESVRTNGQNLGKANYFSCQYCVYFRNIFDICHLTCHKTISIVDRHCYAILHS